MVHWCSEKWRYIYRKRKLIISKMEDNEYDLSIFLFKIYEAVRTWPFIYIWSQLIFTWYVNNCYYYFYNYTIKYKVFINFVDK